MTAYFVYECQVHDQAAYDAYRAAAGPTVTAAGGRYVARGGEVTVIEGAPPLERVVLIEFPSVQAVKDWYDGEGYRTARALREGAATTRIFIVDGAA